MAELERINKQADLIFNVAILVLIVVPILVIAWFLGNAEDFVAVVTAFLGVKLIVLLALKLDDLFGGD